MYMYAVIYSYVYQGTGFTRPTLQWTTLTSSRNFCSILLHILLENKGPFCHQQKGLRVGSVARFYFFQFCDVAEVEIIHKKILARFGYRLDLKVGKKNTRTLLYSWLPTGTYHKILAIWKFFWVEIWRISAIFFSCKNFILLKSFV